MHFGNGFVVGFSEDGKNCETQKVFDNFVDCGLHDVGGIDYRSMPDEGEIKFSNN